ncbi:Hypothetical protein BN69_3131 [Methylocystis sp. SC2]|nr:Hypothetical protein BN69_3131 [Methylocystis sp. SC2]
MRSCADWNVRQKSKITFYFQSINVRQNVADGAKNYARFSVLAFPSNPDPPARIEWRKRPRASAGGGPCRK